MTYNSLNTVAVVALYLPPYSIVSPMSVELMWGFFVPNTYQIRLKVLNRALIEH